MWHRKELPILLLGLLLSANIRADGLFLRSFVWNKAKDINEPAQKAIILHDAGHEDLILQVKYEGPVADFGWLIPVPSRPTVTRATMASFYELSRYVQYHFEYQASRWAGPFATLGNSRQQARDPVVVHEYKTVGAYDIAVLSSVEAGALERWLRENDFAFPAGHESVLAEYVRQNSFFVAARVHLQPNSFSHAGLLSPKDEAQAREESLRSELRSGELHPLKISFDTPDCVYPLKISSLSGNPSEIQLYVLSAEPLIHPIFTPAPAYIRHPEENHPTEYPGELSPWYPAGSITSQELEHCASDLPRLKGRVWALVKHTRIFRCDEMRDLKFEPLLPHLTRYLNGPWGPEVWQKLLSFRPQSLVSIFPELARSPEPAYRTHCCVMLGYLHGAADPAALLILLDDRDPHVLFQAVAAARYYNDSRVVGRLQELLHHSWDRVRWETALACNDLGVRNADVVETLIPALRSGQRGWREEAYKALVQITGRNFEAVSVDQWEEWWRNTKVNFRPN